MGLEAWTRWKYKYWCTDCFGDPYGCFDGGVEESDLIFPTKEEAEEALEKFLGGSIWKGEVIPC